MVKHVQCSIKPVTIEQCPKRTSPTERVCIATMPFAGVTRTLGTNDFWAPRPMGTNKFWAPTNFGCHHLWASGVAEND